MARDGANTDTGCALCGRDVPLTFHHLIPRTLHANKWFQKRFDRDRMASGIAVCRPCHSTVHAHIDNKDLGRTYNTRDALLSHPEVARFVAWVRTQGSRRIRVRR